MALISQGSRIMKASIEAEVNINDIDLVLLKENKFQIKACSVSEHSMEGLAEYNIRSVAKSLEADGILRMKLHTTGFQTILKLIKNGLDNLLFGYSCGCSQVNSPVLKLIFPNLLRIGRNNSQASNGPITMLKSSGKLMDCIIGIYGCFSKWSAVRSEPLLVEDSMSLKKYLEPYLGLKQIEFADVLDRGWDTFEKQSEEMSEYGYVFLG